MTKSNEGGVRVERPVRRLTLREQLDYQIALKVEIMRERTRYLHALEWALGARDEFKLRPEGAGQFWWREELQGRAGLKWDGKKFR